MLLSFIWQILSFTGTLRNQGSSTNIRIETGSFIKTEKLQHFVEQKKLAQKVKKLSTLNLNCLDKLDERKARFIFFFPHRERISPKIITINYMILLQLDCRLLNEEENKYLY